MNELIPFKNWVVTNPRDKVPINPYTGNKADVTDSATWGDYGTAAAIVHYKPHMVLGFVLTNSPFSCIDLDTYKTTDTALINYHKLMFDSFQTYSELSPHHGVHLWMQGKLDGIDGKRFPQQLTEVYCEKRYMTVTMASLNGHRIEDRQDKLKEYVEWSTKEQQSRIKLYNDVPELLTDEEVCKLAANAYNGELFKELYLGNWRNRYVSQSEADSALVNIIAFYTESKEQVGRIYHNSQLGKRRKAHRQDYLYDPKFGIITRAFDQKLPNVRFNDIENLVKNKVEEAALQAIAAPIGQFPTSTETVKSIKELPDFIKDEMDMTFADFPEGLMGDIAKFIYRNAYRPVKEIAIAGAIALMAGICGRFYNVSNMGLNHYIAILAPTGTGKEAASNGIERLVSFIKEKVEHVDLFMGPHAIASSQALMRQLADGKPCCVSRKAEMGLWLQRICNKRASDNLIALRGLLLDLYTRSGFGQIVREEIRADSNKNTPSVTSPAFTLYGDSTPEAFYAALDEEQLDQGLISRFLVIECQPDPENMENPMHDKVVPEEQMIQRLAVLVKRALAADQAGRNQKGDQVTNPLCRHINFTLEAQQYLTEFRKECDAKLLENPNSAEAKVYTRGHERLLRLAGLVAVGVNMDMEIPVVTLSIAQWAKKLIVRTMVNVIYKFERGEVGEANLYIQQRQAMLSIIRKYWRNGYNEELLMKHFNISRDMYNAKIITRGYMNNKIRGCSAFRKSRNLIMDFNNALLDLTKNGILIGPIEMGKVRESTRTGHCYYIHDFERLQIEERLPV